MQRVHTGLLEHLGHDDRLRQLNAALDVVAGVEAEQDRVVRADGGADGVDDLEREAHTVSSVPPYSSVRLLENVDMNWLIR